MTPTEVQGYTAQAAMSTFSIQFENHHNILPTFANVAQVSTSVNVIQIDFGYAPPADILLKAEEEEAIEDDVTLLVNLSARVVMGVREARQLKMILDAALEQVANIESAEAES